MCSNCLTKKGPMLLLYGQTWCSKCIYSVRRGAQK